MKKKRLLIVDDDPQILNMLGDILEDAGYSLSFSANGEEALKKLEEEEFQLVISDVRMPGIDGFELLKAIKERFNSIKVILMTGYTDDYDISDALILGADDYITKPFNISRVLMAIGNAVTVRKRSGSD